MLVILKKIFTGSPPNPHRPTLTFKGIFSLIKANNLSFIKQVIAEFLL